jgi:hypothetical protein
VRLEFGPVPDWLDIWSLAVLLASKQTQYVSPLFTPVFILRRKTGNGYLGRLRKTAKTITARISALFLGFGGEGGIAAQLA